MGFQSPLPTFVNSFIDYANLSSPLNSILATLLAFALLSLFPVTPSAPQPWELPPAPGKLYNWRPAKHDRPQKWEQFTPTQLAIFDGNQEGGKVLIAVRRKVYDVTQGKSFYGPGGPYASFAGRDASRGLAKQSFEADMLFPLEGKDGVAIDRLEDLEEGDWKGLQEWEELFRNKYPVVGDLVPSQ